MGGRKSDSWNILPSGQAVMEKAAFGKLGSQDVSMSLLVWTGLCMAGIGGGSQRQLSLLHHDARSSVRAQRSGERPP